MTKNNFKAAYVSPVLKEHKLGLRQVLCMSVKTPGFNKPGDFDWEYEDDGE